MKQKGTTLHDYNLVHIRHEKVSPFVKFEMILAILCFLLDPFTNKHCRAWSSMINLWIDSRTCQKLNNPSVNKAKVQICYSFISAYAYLPNSSCHF